MRQFVFLARHHRVSPMTSQPDRGDAGSILGVGRGFWRWEVVACAGHPGGFWLPAQEGLLDTQAWLRCRRRALAALAAAACRPRFWEEQLGVDWAATESASARSGFAAPRQAAARAAMMGDSATATRASHWRAISRECPRCAHPEESVEHQLWHCPRWEAVRQQAAAPY